MNANDKTLPIESILAISTSHVSEETVAKLNADDCGLVSFYKIGDAGWMVYVSFAGECQIPSDLFAVIKLAERAGCTWVFLDRDAAAIDALPTFDW